MDGRELHHVAWPIVTVMFIYSISIRGGSIIDIYGVPSRFMRSCVPVMEIHYLTKTTVSVIRYPPPFGDENVQQRGKGDWINRSSRVRQTNFTMQRQLFSAC